MLYDLDDAAEVLRWYRDFMPAQEDGLSGFFMFLTVPPGPPFPEELHMRPVCGIAWTQVGEEESDALKEARAFGNPLLDGIGPVPIPAWNTAFDGLYGPGDQWYWRGEFIREISDEAIAVHADWGKRLPTWKSTMHLYAIDGAASRVGNDDTAWAYRDAKWAQVIAGVDPDPANAQAIADWTRGYSEAIKPTSKGGGYVELPHGRAGPRARDVRRRTTTGWPRSRRSTTLRTLQRQPEHQAHRGLDISRNRRAPAARSPGARATTSAIANHARARRCSCRKTKPASAATPGSSESTTPKTCDGRRRSASISSDHGSADDRRPTPTPAPMSCGSRR